MNAIIAIGIIIVFFILNAVVIRIFHRKQENLEDYAVGGRSFPWILSLFGFIGSWYVGAIYTGSFGDAATIGLFAQYLILYSVTTLITLYILMRPVWIWGKVYNLQTNADLVRLRYNSKWFSTFIAVSTFLFWSPWLVVEIKTIGYMVSASTYGVIPFNLGMIVAGLFVVGYCWLGGARAGVIGDLVQGLFFTVIGTITVLYLLYQAYGGIGPLFQKLAQQAPELLVLNDKIGYGGWSSAIIAGTFGGIMMPGMFMRLYMSKSVAEGKKVVLFVPLIGSLFSMLLIWLGMGGSLLEGFPKDPQSAAFWMADKFGGPAVLGLMGVFALAASMSTISAATLTAAVMIGKNIIPQGQSDDQKVFRLAKRLTLVVGIIAILVATLEIARLVSVILYMYDCIVQVAVPIILGLYWRRGNVYGAAAGTIAGMAIVLLRLPLPWLVSWTDWSAGMVGLAVNLALYVSVSLLTKKQQHVDELFHVLNTYKSTESGPLETEAPKASLAK